MGVVIRSSIHRRVSNMKLSNYDNIIKITLTNSFTNGQVWSNDIFGVDKKYITNVKMISGYKNTVELLFTGIILNST